MDVIVVVFASLSVAYLHCASLYPLPFSLSSPPELREGKEDKGKAHMEVQVKITTPDLS